MKAVLSYFLFVLIFVSCTVESKNKYLSYNNIIIFSDLSSRVENKPLKNFEEIQKIIRFFKEECVKPGEKIGDKSAIYFAAFSENIAASVDLNNFKSIIDKQQFINSTGIYKSNGLENRLNDFERKVKEVYSSTRNPGLDLISILVDRLEKERLVKEDRLLTDGVDTTFIKYNNHVYIFTDGYLEYVNNGGNRQFYFGISEIEKVRAYCKINNVSISKALEDNPMLCLPPYKGKMNEFVTLHVLETHERDKDDKLQTYKFPVGQRDNEILEAVWKKWAKESGFKDLIWNKY